MLACAKTAASLPRLVVEVTRDAKWKLTVMGRDGLRGSCENMVLNYQIFIVGYLQFVLRKDLHTALCSAGYGASNMARKLNSWLSKSDITTPVTNGSVAPSRNIQRDDNNV
jgi:hypothetical protein